MTDVTVIAEKDGYYQSGGGIYHRDDDQYRLIIAGAMESDDHCHTEENSGIQSPCIINRLIGSKSRCVGTPVGYDLAGRLGYTLREGGNNDFVFIMTCRSESMTNAEAKYIY